MPDSRLQKTRAAYPRCELCWARTLHTGRLCARCAPAIAQAAQNLSDAIDAQAAKEVYAEVYGAPGSGWEV